MQILGQRLTFRTGQEFLTYVESAAVHRPKLAENAALGVAWIFRLGERVVEHHEIKRCTDPCNAADQMQPAREQAQPVDDIRFHEYTASRCGSRIALDCFRVGLAGRAGVRPAVRRAGCERSVGNYFAGRLP